MFRETSSSCLLVLIVFVFCDFAISEIYGNLTEITSNEKTSRSVHHRNRHRHKNPTIMTAESPLEGENLDSRIPKLFSFHALDEDLTIDLEFAVPFIHVPVKKSFAKTGEAVKSLVNLNTPALVLTGLFVAGSAVFGLLFHSFVGKTTPGIRRSSRITDVSSIIDPFKFIQRNSIGDKSETAFGDIIQIVEENFNKNDVDITSCIQKTICCYVKKSAERVRGGRGSGTNKIIDGLASSEWLLQYLEGTAVRDAIDSGIGNTNCSFKYPTCQWSNPEKNMLNLAIGLLRNIPGLKDV